MNFSFPYQSILVVCSVNTARSPIVEGYLIELFTSLGLDVEVHSGGVASNARDGMLISLDAKLVMKEEGIDLPETSTSIDLKKHQEYLGNADLILTLTEQHKKSIFQLNGAKRIFNGNIFTLKEFAGEKGDIKDPSMKGVEGFRKARDEIKDCLVKGLKKWFSEDILFSNLLNKLNNGKDSN
ncbi:MAG: Low molecular weight protein-tyrosine-phosphatase YwlE [Promethearchaeota archaeon]|nr:MAG: Low molecular weight protein-tyrosine-phosphatase YwlE [Candidatus Lokiarchaeota archaeon]